MIRFIYISIFLLFFCYSDIYAQLSEGGFPRMPGVVKKATSKVLEMPFVSNEFLRWEAEQIQLNKPLKPLLFAHSFEVFISPLMQGEWFRSEDGWWIWQLRIRSENAYSLNLIFQDYNPDTGNRIFLFTPDYNYVLGAFTELNITEGNVLAVAPLPGDELVVQFESSNYPETAPFVINRINHDFVGILKFFDTRRPLGKTAGDCIPDINCEVADIWRDVQNSVCRIMIEGKELCTGTLVNNTANDSRPFVITANHCISTRNKAVSSLFLFNYESPYCGSIDGDVSNSISGSALRATHDSLDFTLVELSVKPPPSFRPYYAGWNRSSTVSDTVACIQHSQGDIKKISVDNDAPVISSFGLNGYTRNGFWRVNRWEYGATEEGASGGPLFNTKGQVVGSLIGGNSRCSFPVNDYFTRFDMAWDNKPDSSQQLKYWLDPLKSNTINIESKRFYEGPDFCMAFSNLIEGDEHELLRLTNNSGNFSGYWTGTNNSGITEVADKFKIAGDERLQGVSIGIGKRFLKNVNNSSRLRINVYNLIGNMTDIIHTQHVNLRDLFSGAMNHIAFIDIVEPTDSFLIAVNFEGIAEGDTVAIFQSVRQNNPQSSMYIRQNGQWSEFKRSNSAGYTGALAFELIACNVSNLIKDSTVVEIPLEVKLFPNPTLGRVEIAANSNITTDMISVYNLRGQQIPYKSSRLTPRKIEINLAGNSPGIYLIRVLDEKKHFSGKIFLGNH